MTSVLTEIPPANVKGEDVNSRLDKKCRGRTGECGPGRCITHRCWSGGSKWQHRGGLGPPGNELRDLSGHHTRDLFAECQPLRTVQPWYDHRHDRPEYGAVLFRPGCRRL